MSGRQVQNKMPTTNLKAFSASALFAAALSACTLSVHAATTAPSLEDLIKQSTSPAASAGIPDIRYNAIVDTARTRGNSAGLAWQYGVIKKRLEGMASNLDIIYNFGALMMEGNVLPPVMSKALDVYDQKADDLIRLVGETYSIRQPARFTYVAPSWRSYLLAAEYNFDASIAPLVTPENDREREVWTKALEDGYKMGIEQANQILDANFARLKADFEGMRLYRELLRKGMVTKPYVSTGHYGVTGDKKGSINIGESLLRISVSPEFVMDSDRWNSKPQGRTAEMMRAAKEGVIHEVGSNPDGAGRENRGVKP